MERPRMPDNNKNGFDWEYIFELNRYIDWLKRQLKISELLLIGSNELPFCGCIDKCSSKKDDYWCRVKRKCVHKIVR